MEISNSYADYFSFDEEYYGVILAKIIEVMIHRTIKAKLLETTIQFSNHIMEAFWDFTSSQSLQQLYIKARKHFQRVLSISQMALYFLWDNALVTFTTQGSTWDGVTHSHNTTHGPVYESNGKQVSFSKEQGLAG